MQFQVSGNIGVHKTGDDETQRLIRVDDFHGGASQFLPYPVEQDDSISGFFVCKGMILFQGVRSFKVFRMDPASKGSGIQQAGCLDARVAGFGHWRGDYYAFMPEGRVFELVIEQENCQWIPWANTGTQVESILANGSEVEEEHGIVGVYEDPGVGKTLGLYKPWIHENQKMWTPVSACGEGCYTLTLLGAIGNMIVAEVDLDPGPVVYGGYDVRSGEWSEFKIPNWVTLRFPVSLAAHGGVYLNQSTDDDCERVEVYKAEVDWKEQRLVNATKLFKFFLDDFGSLF